MTEDSLTVGPGAIVADGTTTTGTGPVLLAPASPIAALPDVTGLLGPSADGNATVTLEATVQPTADTPQPVDSASFTRLGAPPPLQSSVVLLGRVSNSVTTVPAPDAPLFTLPPPAAGAGSSFATLQVH